MNLVPYNEEFEKAVIVGVLQDPMLLPKLTQIITADDFYKADHKQIFKAISELATDNLDSLTVEEQLPESAKVYFKELIQDSDKILPSLGNIQYYAEVIKGKSRKRAGIELGREIQTLCYDSDIEGEEAVRKLEDMFATFLQQRVLEGRGADNSKTAFQDFITRLSDDEIDNSIYTITGYKDVDLLIHRLEGLIILAARPGMGKTAFAINIARNVAETKPVLFFSVEQSRDQIFERLLTTESGVPLEHIRTKAFRTDPDEVISIEAAAKKLEIVMENMHVDESANIPTEYITSVTRQKHYEYGGLGLVVIDYLHILQIDKKRNTTDSLGDAVKEIRQLGKELNVPVLLLSQLRRPPNESGSKRNKRPDLEDLRSSGEIEQSADIVIFLFRESYYDEGSFAPPQDIVEVDVKKNRNGRPGRVLLEWIPAILKFRDQRR